MKKVMHILMMSVMMAACSKPAPMRVAADEPMQIYAMTKSPTDFGADTPVFLFWLDNDFYAIGEGVYTQPYLEAWPSGEIDDYNPSKTTYDTGKEYPENDQVVYCTGYYPASLIVDGGSRPRSWTGLEVPAEDIGLMDVMVARTPITGKSTEHFETKDPKEPLEFIHAQSKVSFKAKMSSDMAKNRYLRNVVVTVRNTPMMSSLKWNGTRYIADGSTDMVSVTLRDPNQNQLDPNQTSRDLGHVYIYPGQESVDIKVEVEMSDSPLFEESELISLETVVKFNPATGESDILEENDAYEIVLVINYESIALEGKKAPWEEGGKITIPF